MTANCLEVHPASDTERLDAYRNVHEFWGGDLTLEQHLQRRLASAQHNRATWYVGCLNGRVVSSLGCYPMQYSVRGHLRRGMAIGAVHTLPGFRGRGYASQLIRQVEHDQRGRGATISVLYSDIDPSYYERIGYTVCKSFRGIRVVEGTSVAPLDDRWNLQEFLLDQEVSQVADIYDQYHRNLAFSVARDEEYWSYLGAKSVTDEFYWLDGERRLGFVRLGRSEQKLSIRDLALVDHEHESLDVLLATIDDLARRTGCDQITGWLPDLPTRGQLFQLELRSSEITMVKCLAGEPQLDQNVVTDAQHFHEIDHV